MRIIYVFFILIISANILQAQLFETPPALRQRPVLSDTTNQFNENDERIGYWCDHFLNGNLRYEGYFIDGKPVGRFVYYFPEGGLRAELIHVPDEEAVQATFYHRRRGAVMAEGQYVNQKKQGLWRMFNEQGRLVMENYFHDDKNHGVWKTYNNTGEVIELVTYHYGVKQGEFIKYYGNGNKRIHANYHNDKLHGEYMNYHPNGRIMTQGYYYKNLPDRRWTHAARNGDVEKIIVYDKGEILEENIFIERDEDYYQDDDQLKPFTDPYKDLFPGLF